VQTYLQKMMTARQGCDHLWAYTLIGDMAGLREEIWKLLGPDSLPLPGVWRLGWSSAADALCCSAVDENESCFLSLLLAWRRHGGRD